MTNVCTTERRVWLRFPSHAVVAFQPAADPSIRLSGLVRDVSLGGIRLLAHRGFRTGELLNVVLPKADGPTAETMLACVVHAVAQDAGEWSLGCSFISELSEEALQGLL